MTRNWDGPDNLIKIIAKEAAVKEYRETPLWVRPALVIGYVDNDGDVQRRGALWFSQASAATMVAASATVAVLTVAADDAKRYKRMYVHVQTPVNNTSYDLDVLLHGLAIRDDVGAQRWFVANSALLDNSVDGQLPYAASDIIIQIHNDDGVVDMTGVIVSAYLYDPY